MDCIMFSDNDTWGTIKNFRDCSCCEQKEVMRMQQERVTFMSQYTMWCHSVNIGTCITHDNVTTSTCCDFSLRNNVNLLRLEPRATKFCVKLRKLETETPEMLHKHNFMSARPRNWAHCELSYRPDFCPCWGVNLTQNTSSGPLLRNCRLAEVSLADFLNLTQNFMFDFCVKWQICVQTLSKKTYA